jgi:hypothetical protein
MMKYDDIVEMEKWRNATVNPWQTCEEKPPLRGRLGKIM